MEFKCVIPFYCILSPSTTSQSRFLHQKGSHNFCLFVQPDFSASPPKNDNQRVCEVNMIRQSRVAPDWICRNRIYGIQLLLVQKWHSASSGLFNLHLVQHRLMKFYFSWADFNATILPENTTATYTERGLFVIKTGYGVSY